MAPIIFVFQKTHRLGESDIRAWLALSFYCFGDEQKQRLAYHDPDLGNELAKSGWIIVIESSSSSQDLQKRYIRTRIIYA
jgi:hypothetical protein